MQAYLQAMNADIEATVCPVCHKRLKTTQGLTAHLKTARACQWYKKGKLKELTLPGMDESTPELLDIENLDIPPVSTSREEDPGDVAEDIYDRLYDFVPLDPPEAEPGPSRRITSWPAEDNEDEDFDDDRVEEVFEGAGKVVRMDKTVHERWQRQFGGSDEEGNVLMEEDIPDINKYAPFASELDWRVARWAVQEGIGHKSLDRLLAIPGVSVCDNYDVMSVSAKFCHSIIYGR